MKGSTSAPKSKEMRNEIFDMSETKDFGRR